MENKDGKSSAALLAKAKADLAEDMEARGLAAIIWDNASAGFHNIPTAESGNGRDVRVAGIYRVDGVLYLLDEESRKADMDRYYDRNTEVKPTVVCLSPSVAQEKLGDPAGDNAFVADADLDQWLVIADCYFEALNEG